MGPPKLCAKLNGNGYKITLEESFDLFKRYKATFKRTIAWLYEQQNIAACDFVMTNMNGRKRHFNRPDAHAIKTVIASQMLSANASNALTMVQMGELSRRTEEEYNKQIGSVKREGANFQVQSVNVEWTKVAMYEMRKEFKRLKYDVKMHNAPYDEIVLDAHKNCAEDVHALQSKIMIASANRFMKVVPVEVEGHLKPYWTK